METDAKQIYKLFFLRIKIINVFSVKESVINTELVSHRVPNKWLSIKLITRLAYFCVNPLSSEVSAITSVSPHTIIGQHPNREEMQTARHIPSAVPLIKKKDSKFCHLLWTSVRAQHKEWYGARQLGFEFHAILKTHSTDPLNCWTRIYAVLPMFF